MSWSYDAWRLQSPEDAGFYRFDESEDYVPEEIETQAIVVDLISGWIEAHNQCVLLDSGQGDASALAYAACCVSLAHAFGLDQLEQVQQLRANMGRISAGFVSR